MEIGRVIKVLRTEKKLTQYQLAEKANVSRDLIASIEQERTNGSEKSKKRICDVLGVNPAYLYIYSLDEGDLQESKRYAFRLIKDSVLDILSDTHEEDDVMDK